MHPDRRRALAWVILLNGCGTLDMVSPDPSVAEWRDVSVESWNWGASPGRAELSCPVLDDDAPALSEVVFVQSAGDHVLHVLTLGGYGHATIRYRCAQPRTDPSGAP